MLTARPEIRLVITRRMLRWATLASVWLSNSLRHGRYSLQERPAYANSAEPRSDETEAKVHVAEVFLVIDGDEDDREGHHACRYDGDLSQHLCGRPAKVLAYRGRICSTRSMPR